MPPRIPRTLASLAAGCTSPAKAGMIPTRDTVRLRSNSGLGGRIPHVDNTHNNRKVVMAISGQKMRSSFAVPHAPKLDPDLWLVDRSEAIYSTTRLHPTGDPEPRWIETLIFDNDHNRVTSTIIDRQTSQTVSASHQYQTIASAAAKQQIGMP